MILTGDCRDVLPTLPADSVHCCVTSPPYFGLRSYLRADHPDKAKEIGSEQLHDCLGWATGAPCGACFVCVMVDVFRHVRRVLRPDGVLWINLGDSYCHGTGADRGPTTTEGDRVPASWASRSQSQRNRPQPGIKTKDLFGMPWRLALALQADGWWWRDTVVWRKPNPMPSSVNDRCTPAWEPVLMMTKSARYFFDWRAIATQASTTADSWKMADGWDTGPGGHGAFHRNGREKGRPAGTRANNGVGWGYADGDAAKPRTLARKSAAEENRNDGQPRNVGGRNSFARDTKSTAGEHGQKPQHRPDREPVDYDTMARRRNVWDIPTQGYSEAHFATFPERLPELCILATCPPGRDRARHLPRIRNHRPGRAAARPRVDRHRPKRRIRADAGGPRDARATGPRLGHAYQRGTLGAACMNLTKHRLAELVRFGEDAAMAATAGGVPAATRDNWRDINIILRDASLRAAAPDHSVDANKMGASATATDNVQRLTPAEIYALALDECGHHTEAQNVRAGVDLDDYCVGLTAVRFALSAGATS